MSLKRIALLLVSMVVLSALGFAALHGASVLAQDTEGPGLVVFTSDRTGDFEIYVLDPQTGLTTQLTDSPGDDIEPQWSPDGENIVFVSDRDGDYELYIMRADGSDVQQITRNNAEDRQPRWQPDGENIVYVSDVNGQWDLYVISPDGAIVRQLTNDMFDERGPVAEAPADEPSAGPVTQPTVFPTFTPVPTESPDAVVDSANLNVRANPGTGAQIVARLRAGDTVELVARYYDFTYQESWVQIRMANGTMGWVYEPLLTLNVPLTSLPSVAAQYIAPPPTATPTPEATAVPTVIIEFWADRGTINAGECVTISWRVENIREVYYKGQGVVGQSSVQECPAATTTYNLRVIRQDGIEDNRFITITVN